MKVIKHRILLISLSVIVFLSLCICLTSCSDDSDTDPDAGDYRPSINVYIPSCDIVVPVEYDEKLGQLISLSEKLEDAMSLLNISTNDLRFLGLYDMAEGGNIIYSIDGYLYSDYVFTEGLTLFAQYEEVVDYSKDYYRITVYPYEEFDKRNEGSASHAQIKIREGKIYIDSCPSNTYYNRSYFKGWYGDVSKKVVTDRDGYTIDGYDLFTSGDTVFYPVYATSKVLRSIFHTDSGDVTVEAASYENLTPKAPIDDNGTRQIIGWSSDPKAKYIEDIEYRTYRGETNCKMYAQTEGQEFFPIYSEYKETKIVWNEYSITKRIFKKCTDEYSYVYLNELNSFEKEAGYESVYAAAFLTNEGDTVVVGRVEYSELSSQYSIIEKYTKPHSLTVLLVDSKKGTETKFILTLFDAKAYLNFPNDDPLFLGWFRDAESTADGEIEYIRFEASGEYAYVKYKNKNEEVRQSVGNTGYDYTTLTLYAIYEEESEGDAE